jgi:hypothetical protein
MEGTVRPGGAQISWRIRPRSVVALQWIRELTFDIAASDWRILGLSREPKIQYRDTESSKRGASSIL